MKIPTDPYIVLYEFWERFGSTPYFKPALIIIGVFILVILLALVKKHIFELSMRGAIFGFFFGVIVMLILDLIVVFGLADKSKVGKLTSGQNRQEVAQEIFVSGVSGLGNVLGLATNVTTKTQKPKAVEEVISGYLSLPSPDAQKFKDLLCPQ